MFEMKRLQSWKPKLGMNSKQEAASPNKRGHLRTWAQLLNELKEGRNSLGLPEVQSSDDATKVPPPDLLLPETFSIDDMFAEHDTVPEFIPAKPSIAIERMLPYFYPIPTPKPSVPTKSAADEMDDTENALVDNSLV
ncbi:hypothetical protein M427DRAFT_218511 [Gonapodya prolifera JEL478]|uniref:Uncharacterized protein n=1 Tax=Gonapodya prolifera (strain JEL478) TaxID=1344416 RepID=A0A138ZYL7_GONPJ|nr:hypothetical protein M427DRAFT_218511 [Gonapodya prolifera JEL478]|eukprot:KXS09597.1 hypothetical protein M427DRAFT_218511 [Gonapodya prolifera JEL478]